MSKNANVPLQDISDNTIQAVVSDVDQNGESYMSYENISVHHLSNLTNGKLKELPATEVENVVFCSAGKGWTSDWHNEPYPLLAILNRGGIIFETSDQNKKVLNPGSMVIGKDVHGKGHRTINIGGDTVLITLLKLKHLNLKS